MKRLMIKSELYQITRAEARFRRQTLHRLIVREAIFDLTTRHIEDLNHHPLVKRHDEALSFFYAERKRNQELAAQLDKKFEILQNPSLVVQ
jgi:hypothetical protein